MIKLFEYLKLNNLTVASCESFTGGYFADEFTNIPGASDFFKGAYICYTNEYKSNILEIDIEVIKKYTEVSREVISLMLEKTKEKLKCNVVFAFTGYAPPMRDKTKQGNSFVGFIKNNEKYIFEFKNFENISRSEYKKLACEFILNKFLIS